MKAKFQQFIFGRNSNQNKSADWVSDPIFEEIGPKIYVYEITQKKLVLISTKICLIF